MRGSEERPDAEGTGASAPLGRQVNPLEVLDNFLGETASAQAIEKLTLVELRQLGEAAKESATAALQDPVPDSTFYQGGWVSGHWQYQITRGDLNLSLLYYPRLLVHDPIAEFFFDEHDSLPPMRPLRERFGRMTIDGSGPRMWSQHSSFRPSQENLNSSKQLLASIVQYMSQLRPLLEADVLICRYQYPTLVARSEAIMNSVSHDVRSERMQRALRRANEMVPEVPVPTWDSMRGLSIRPDSGFHLVDAPWASQFAFYFLAKTLAIADQAGAVYVPPEDGDLHLLREKVRDSVRPMSKGRHPAALLRQVARLVLPDLQLSADTAVSIRRSEEAFDDWRRRLSSLARDAAADDADDLRERVEDELIPTIRRLETATAGSRLMRGSLRDQPASVTFSALTAGGGALLIGRNPAAAAGVTLGSGILHWIYQAYLPRRPDSKDAVLASLIRARTSGPAGR